MNFQALFIRFSITIVINSESAFTIISACTVTFTFLEGSDFISRLIISVAIKSSLTSFDWSSTPDILERFSKPVIKTDILSAALVVGLAGGILVVLEEGKIIDTILYSVSNSMDGTGKTGSISIMYVIQTFINVIIPSGSAKAALTMPVMAPFSDLVGLSRQATVMAFQFGDGFTNMITPTSGVLIGALGIAKIPYDKWLKWILPFMAILIFVGWLLLLPKVLMELNGF